MLINVKQVFYVQEDKTWYNYFIPPTSIRAKVGKGGIMF